MNGLPDSTQDPYSEATEIKITRWEDIPEGRRTALLAEKAAHDAAHDVASAPSMDCVWCMFGHYPVTSRDVV